MCAYIYIYIYIYMGQCLCVLWVASRIIFSIFEAVLECLKEPLCLFWWKDHTKNCASMNLCDRRKEWRMFVSQEWDSWVETHVRSPGCEAGQRAVWSQERRHRVVKMITRWVSIFGSCVGFSLSSHDSYTYTQRMLKSAKLHLCAFCSSESVFCPFFLPSSVVYFIFLYNLWNAHSAGVI